MSAPTITADLTLVAYDDDVYLYPASDERATIVYTTAIGANLDAVKATVTAARWESIRDQLGHEVTIHDHREHQATIAVRWQHCAAGLTIDGDPYAEQDADEVRAWTGDMCAVAATRTSAGRWAIDTSDVFQVSLTDHRRRFASPAEALEHLAAKAGHAVTTDN
ncbi:hypothetical protein AB0M43_37840 [Longispora sp. NPDC051575]|uniref:hypothetical protein n=1 Tax=Longispora sp. NPDC051575 TaxID=3154943 RepID=UPI003442B3CB